MGKNKENLVYNVYRQSFNDRKIVEFNIFKHYSFAESIQKIKEQFYKDKKKFIKENTEQSYEFWKQQYKNTTFKEKVDSALMYYFWSKSEHEVIITSWPPYCEKDELNRLKESRAELFENVNLSIEKKVDIYEQVKMNFDIFIDYLWDNVLGYNQI